VQTFGPLLDGQSESSMQSSAAVWQKYPASPPAHPLTFSAGEQNPPAPQSASTLQFPAGAHAFESASYGVP